MTSASHAPQATTAAGSANRPAMPVSAATATVAINGSASVRDSEIRRTVVSRGDTRSHVTPIGSKGPAEVGVAEVMAPILALTRRCPARPRRAAPRECKDGRHDLCDTHLGGSLRPDRRDMGPGVAAADDGPSDLAVPDACLL